MTDAPPTRTGLGFLAAGFGFLIMPLADALGKALGVDGVHPLQIGWGRWLAHAAVTVPLVLIFYGPQAFRPNRLGSQIVRALFLCAATALFFFALIDLPLPTVTATLFLAPLIVTALSPFILGERVGIRRASAVLVGFVGMLLIVNPGAGAIEIGSLYALGAASCFAGYLLTTRLIAGRSPALVTMMWMGVIGFFAMSLIVWPVFQPFTLAQWGMVGLIGIILTIGHGLIVWAADRLEASALAPMPYLEMITSTLIGLFVFDEFPEFTVWAGCGLVIVGGLFVAWRESRMASTPRKDVSPRR